jgi:hypothetical protein
MIDLRQSNIYELNEGIFGIEDTKRKYCSMGMLKCVGILLFLSGISGVSFYIGIKLRMTPCPMDGSV